MAASSPFEPLFKKRGEAWLYLDPQSMTYAHVPGNVTFYHDIWNPDKTEWDEMEALNDVPFLRGGFYTRSYSTMPLAVGDMGCVKWSSKCSPLAHGLVGAFIVVEIGREDAQLDKYCTANTRTDHGSYAKIIMEPFPAAVRARPITKAQHLGFNEEHADEFYKRGNQFWKEISRDLFLKELAYGLPDNSEDEDGNDKGAKTKKKMTNL